MGHNITGSTLHGNLNTLSGTVSCDGISEIRDKSWTASDVGERSGGCQVDGES